LETLAVGQQQPYALRIGFVNEMTFAQGAFSFGRLFSQNVTGTGFIIHNFSGARFAKAFGSRAICFYFRHL